MPWSRQRAHRPNGLGNSPRRHSTVEPAQLAESVNRHNNETVWLDPQHNIVSSSLANSSTAWLETADEGDETSALNGQPLPAKQDPPQRVQRFSLLRFRHASDSQLSRTARDQSMLSPSMPPREFFSRSWKQKLAERVGRLMFAKRPRLLPPHRRWNFLIRHRKGKRP